jgi:hypothetical protein
MLISKPFACTDGGRVDAGIRDKNDCAVRAYALYEGISYEQAHTRFRDSGRRNGKGTSFSIIEQHLGKPVVHWKERKSAITLKRLLQQYPTGKVYAIKRGHAFTIIDGVVHDTFYAGDRSRVIQYWVKDQKPVVSKQESSDESRLQEMPLKERVRIVYTILMREGKSVAEIVNGIAFQLDITKANARYYVTRVFNK